MNTSIAPTHFNVFIVEEYDAPTKDDKAHKARSWTKVGAAFPHKEGTGFNIELKALPVNGRLVAFPAEAAEQPEAAPATAPAAREVRAVRR
jgi:hypothetical protein